MGRTRPLQTVKSNSVFRFFIKAKEHSGNRVKAGLVSPFQRFRAFVYCRYERHLSLVFSTLTETHLDKNEKQNSIPHTLNRNS